ncbi:cytochrome c3 family protein [Sphingomonas flavalba]|uniref:cytochrome c3 family protein n=1 Tax=Sphingomonas flavalba TaxID=2559804 RepID=UPI0039DFB88C
MKRSVWIGISLILAVIIYLSFTRPHEMVSPGNLIPAHAGLESNCFACHAPFQGASADRCTTCHAVADIGLRTTKGVAIPQSERRPAFHQALTEPNCMSCHSDHPRPRLTKASAVKFDHGLLKVDARANCQSCHTAPQDDLHRGPKLACATCHQPAHWKPATFNHSRYFLLDGDHNGTSMGSSTAA